MVASFEAVWGTSLDVIFPEVGSLVVLALPGLDSFDLQSEGGKRKKYIFLDVKPTTS